MPDSSLKKVAVLDASSYAGYSAALHLAFTRNFTVQAIAENFSRKSAESLANLEVEPHIIDFCNVGVDHLESILHNTEGLYLVFDVDQNNFDVKCFTNKLFEAVKKTRIRFLLFSSTISPLVRANIRAPRMERIAEVELAVRKLPLSWSVLVQPLPYEAFLKQMLPVKLGPDRFGINFPNPTCGVESMALNDIGPIVASIMENFDEFRYKTIPLTSEKIYLRDIINSFNNIMPPKHFEGYQMSFNDYEKSVSEMDQEWGSMFMCHSIADMERNRDLSLNLNPNLRSMHHWIVDNFKLFCKLFDKT